MSETPSAVTLRMPVESETERTAPAIPPFPWDRDLRSEDLSTTRGFVFQYPPFPSLEHTDAAVVDTRTTAGLYVHLPFCPYRCSYCYYAVEVNRTDDDVDAYLHHLSREIELVAARPAVAKLQTRTLFFGGGTPTFLNAARFERVMADLARHIDLSALDEVTVEADPTTVDTVKIAALVGLGVNRMSIGVQTFDNELNMINERAHTRADTERAIEAVRAGGIVNLNLDLICGLAGDTEAGWHRTMDELLAIAPEHVTIYLFSLRPQTKAHVRLGRGTMPQPPAEEQRVAMFLEARERLLGAGYVQTTPNCFVRDPRWEQLHQANAWSSLPLVGLGNSAYSFVDDCVTQNVRPVSAYAGALDEGRVPVELGFRLDSRELMIRYCVLRLKQLSIPRVGFAARFGFDVLDVLGGPLARLEDLGLLTVDHDAVRLTVRGIVYVDDVCRAIYSQPSRDRLAASEADASKLVRSLI